MSYAHGGLGAAPNLQTPGAGNVTNPGYLPALSPTGPQRRVPPEPTVHVPPLLNVPARPIAKTPTIFEAFRAAIAAPPRVLPPQTTTYVAPSMGALAVQTAPVAPSSGVPQALTDSLNAAVTQAQAIAASNPSNPIAQQYAALVEQNASDVGGVAADVGGAQLVVGVTPTSGMLAQQATKLLGNPVVVLGVVGALLYIATRSSRR